MILTDSHLLFSDMAQRPKKLLIFINPFGGRKNSMQIYTRYGKPLFEIAGVDVTVNVSQRKDQIRDFLINGSLEMFDSVACVGGDGTVSELFNGLVLRECRNKGIDADNINTPLPSPRLPIGIIPGKYFLIPSVGVLVRIQNVTIIF